VGSRWSGARDGLVSLIFEEWMQALSAKAWVRIAQVCLLVLGVLSCDSPSGPSPVVVVTPTGVVTLNVGDTLTVRAVVQNASQPSVRFTSSNAAVASVDEATGLVHAFTAGEVTITALSVQDPQASASVQVLVRDPPASIVISQILNASGGLIDPTRVAGTVNVQLAVELGGATRLDVLVDTAVACQQSFVGATATATASAALASTTITCPINTAQFDPATGATKFPNGQSTIRARLVGADGRTRSETVGFPLVLANANTIRYQVLAEKQATDAAGLQWVDGSLTLTVLPVLYDRGESLVLAEFLFQVTGGRVHRRSDSTPPFSAVFEADSLANLTQNGVVIFIHTATAAGQPGPAAVTAPLRYDSQAPLPGNVEARDWMGAGTTFAGRYAPAPNGDHGGVGRVTARFYAGDPILSDSALVARGKQVVNGADLQPGAAGSYRAAALVCDALDNCTLRSGFRFGVDLTPPSIEEVDLEDRVVNPNADLRLRVQDDLSGFDPRPLEVTVSSLDANPATPTCGPEVEGIDLPGRQLGGGCVPDTLAPRVPVPRSTSGYYTYTLTPVDRAGNRGATVTRRVLVDRVGPELTSFVVGGPYLPGDEGVFTASATDNLDLVDIVFRLVFPGSPASPAIALPFATDSVVVGTAFDAETTVQGTRTSRFPVVRTLTTVSAASRSIVVVDSVQAQAVDAAGLTATLSRPITLSGTVPTLDPFATATTVEPTLVASERVCTRGCVANDRTTLGISMRIAGTSALTQPFARVYFFRRDQATGAVHLLGSSITVAGEVEAGRASFTYPFTYTPPAGLEGSFSVFAVGVNSAGYALRNPGSTVVFFQR
jgi:hypothetical protein